VTIVSVDPVDYADAASNFEAIRANVVRRLGTLSRELRSYDNMAGTDPGGRQFSVQYDAGAADIVTGLDYLAVRASELDFGLMSTASEHYLTEQVAAGNVSASTIYQTRPPYAGENPGPPPSSFGGDPNPPTDTLGEIWATVAGFIGQMFPDGNVATLRRAAKTWTLIGEHLDEVASEVGRADDPLTGNRSREIGLIQAEVRELKSLITQMALEAEDISGSCTDYAQIVEETLEETFAMLRQLAIEVAVGAGISVALSFVTFGGAAVVGAAALTARIIAVAARIGGLIGRVLSAAGNLALRIGSAAARVRTIVAQLAPRTQRIIRITSTVGGETGASLFAEGVVRGDNANYVSAFAGGLVGSGSTLGVLSIFGNRAAQLLPNLLAGGVGGFTGSLASGGVEGNITTQNLIFGTVFGTAGGSLGTGGSHGGGSHAPTGAAPTVSGSGGSSSPGGGGTHGSGSTRPPLGEGPIVPHGAGDSVPPPVDVDPFTPQVDVNPVSPHVDVNPVTPHVDIDPVTPHVDVDPVTPHVDVDPVTPPVDVDPFTPELDVAGPVDGGTPHVDGGASPADGASPPTSHSDAPPHPRDYPPPHDGPVIHEPAPGSGTPFAARTDLEPNSTYVVDGRGTFYTGPDGRVIYVETSYGGTGNLNADLMKPQPNMTYVVRVDVDNPIPGVNHSHVFETNADGNTVLAHTDGVASGAADRSPSIQSKVGNDAGPLYEGGHYFGNANAGGGEYINIAAMLQQVNRGGGASYGNLELFWRSQPGNPQISVTIRSSIPDGLSTPTKFEVDYSINGGKPVRREFLNG